MQIRAEKKSTRRQAGRHLGKRVRTEKNNQIFRQEFQTKKRKSNKTDDDNIGVRRFVTIAATAIESTIRMNNNRSRRHMVAWMAGKKFACTHNPPRLETKTSSWANNLKKTNSSDKVRSQIRWKTTKSLENELITINSNNYSPRKKAVKGGWCQNI